MGSTDSHFLEKFLKRLKQFAYEEDLIREIVRDILDSGIIGNIISLNIPFFSTVLLNIAQLNNQLTANYLEQLFKNTTPIELRELLTNRRNVLMTLEHLIWFKETFKVGMDILIKLSIGENENWANSATGLIPEKFRVYLPGTSASLGLRIKYLSDLISNSTKEISFLIPMIFNAIFYLDSGHRMINAEIQSNKPIPKEYIPNQKEFLNYLNQTFELFIKQFENQEFIKSGLEIIKFNLKLFIDIEKFEDIKQVWELAIEKDNEFKIELINYLEYRYKNENIFEKIKKYIDELKEDYDLLDIIKEFSGKSPIDFRGEDIISKSLEIKKKISTLEREKIYEILEWLLANYL